MSCTARSDYGFQTEGEYKLLGKDGEDSGADHLKQYQQRDTNEEIRKT